MRGAGPGRWVGRSVPGLALVVSGLGGLALALPASPAAADTYGPQAQCVMSVSPTSLYPGQSFQVTVTVGPGSLPVATTAAVMVGGSSVPLGTITVPTTGTSSATLIAPTSLTPGLHTISVNGCGAVLADGLTVQPSTAPASSSVIPTAAPVTPAAAPAAAAVVPVAGAAAPVTAASSGLAFTGADVVTTVAAGAGAIGLGGVFVLVGRKRRSRG